MTAQHTPGPWEVADCLMNEDERWVHSSELGGVIAGVWPWGDDEVGEQQREANARLIAAAPRMYDYISARADTGDAEAVAILEAIHGNA